MLDFSGAGEEDSNSYQGFGIWSVRWSGDGREIIAGTNNESVYVYDVQTQKVGVSVSNSVSMHSSDGNDPPQGWSKHRREPFDVRASCMYERPLNTALLPGALFACSLLVYRQPAQVVLRW